MKQEKDKDHFNKNNQNHIPHYNILSQKQIQNYFKLLSYSNLKCPQEISFSFTKIYENQYMHSIDACKNVQNSQHMIMLHGYGSSAPKFIRLFEHFSQRYQVHSLDALGVGYSSLGHWNNNFTPQQVINYHVQAIESWTIKNFIKEFIFMGHSYGAYIAVNYAKKYPQKIKELILLSPAGFVSKDEEQMKNRSIFNKISDNFNGFFYNFKVTPVAIAKNFVTGFIMIEGTLQYFHITGQQKTQWKNYMNNISLRQNTSEKGFYLVFDWPLKPKLGDILDIIKQQHFKFKIKVFFGDKDWMRKTINPDEKVQKQKLNLQNLIYKIISKSDHEIMFDNPSELIEEIEK